MNWHSTLTELGTIIHTKLDSTMIYYEKSLILNNWLGFDSAVDNAIENKEKELGVVLPTSYKNFLKVSNGFRQISHFSGNLLPVEKIDWLRNTDPEFISLCNRYETIEIPDSDYYVYDTEVDQDLRIEYFKDTIQISEWTDGAIILLNPMVRFEDEFEVWLYANWAAGAKRYKSFADLINGELKSTLKLLEEEEEK